MRVVLGGQLRRAGVDMKAVMLRSNRCERAGPLERRMSLAWRVQLDVRVAQAQFGHCQLWIEPERLMKRPRRFNPYERMQVREALIVERLGGSGHCRHIVVGHTDAGPQRQRAFDEL